MCCCPGGKTTHLATLSNNDAEIIALDRSRSKIAKFVKHIGHLGLTSINAYCCDSTGCVLSAEDSLNFSLKDLGAPGKCIRGLPRAYFDRILLDGPCSALGQRPSLGAKNDISTVTHHPHYQRSLMHAAHALLKPSGKMVFSTCTFATAENESNIQEFLETFPDMRIISPDNMPWKQNAQSSRIPHVNDVCRFDPDVPCSIVDGIGLESIGFFFAVLEKGEI